MGITIAQLDQRLERLEQNQERRFAGQDKRLKKLEQGQKILRKPLQTARSKPHSGLPVS